MRKYFKGFYLPAMLGAGIEYYDIALYGYMAPVLIQVFLPHLDKTTAYFLYFIFEFFAAIFQLTGAGVFGYIGDKYGRKPAMYGSMMGISCVTFFMCLLPSYTQVGLLATLLFMLMRALQCFFLGGEYNGGAIYLLEHEADRAKHNLISGLYCAFTVSGIVLASIVALVCNKMGPEYFRIAYAVSFLLALITYKMRSALKETPIYQIQKQEASPSYSIGKIVIFRIMISALFFGVLYGFPTRILNALLPIAIGVSSEHIMLLNTSSLILYMGLLIWAGLLANRHGPNNVMRLAAIIVCVASYPLMMLIQSGYWGYIILAKIIFTVLIALFMGPFHSWAQAISSSHNRYKSISVSYALGKIFSTGLLAGSFLVYDFFKSIAVLGVILSFIAFITVGVFYDRSNKKVFKALLGHKY